jgi:hypothetical protein
MNPPLPILLALLAGAGLWGFGCATRNVNPPQARANTGYVDFYSAPPDDLFWEVARFDPRTQNFKTIISEFAPPPHGVVRLALAPGPHRLRVTFLNRVIANPVEITIELQDQKIMPVCVTLTSAGTALVETKEHTRGGTARGRYGPRTKIGSDTTTRHELSAQAAPPLAYQRKEQMSYAH